MSVMALCIAPGLHGNMRCRDAHDEASMHSTRLRYHVIYSTRLGAAFTWEKPGGLAAEWPDEQELVDAWNATPSRRRKPRP